MGFLNWSLRPAAPKLADLIVIGGLLDEVLFVPVTDDGVALVFLGYRLVLRETGDLLLAIVDLGLAATLDDPAPAKLTLDGVWSPDGRCNSLAEGDFKMRRLSLKLVFTWGWLTTDGCFKVEGVCWLEEVSWSYNTGFMIESRWVKFLCKVGP